MELLLLAVGLRAANGAELPAKIYLADDGSARVDGHDDRVCSSLRALLVDLQLADVRLYRRIDSQTRAEITEREALTDHRLVYLDHDHPERSGPSLPKPLTVGGWYEHSDGTMGYYAWKSGRSHMIAIARDRTHARAIDDERDAVMARWDAQSRQAADEAARRSRDRA